MGAKIPHGLPAKKPKLKQMQCCNKFNEGLKKWSTSTTTKKIKNEKKKRQQGYAKTVPGILLYLLSHYNFQVIFNITNENGFP